MSYWAHLSNSIHMCLMLGLENQASGKCLFGLSPKSFKTLKHLTFTTSTKSSANIKQKLKSTKWGLGLVCCRCFTEAVLASHQHLLLIYIAKLVQQLIKIKTQIWDLQRESESKHFTLCQMLSSAQRVISVPDEIIKRCYPHMEVISTQLLPHDASKRHPGYVLS